MSVITKNVLANLQTASATVRRSSIELRVRGQELVNRIRASNEIERYTYSGFDKQSHSNGIIDAAAIALYYVCYVRSTILNIDS